jgi:hypothetical protein
MAKRLTRYTGIADVINHEGVIKQASNTSIILKDGKVYTGRIISITQDKVIFENMRLSKQEVVASELREIITDQKSE